MKKLQLFVTIGVCILILGCDKIEQQKTNPIFSIWLPEWEKEAALKDVKIMESELQNIYLFGAYFNQDKQPFLTENGKELLLKTNELYRDNHKIILTFINDYVPVNHTAIQKDPALIHTFVQNEYTRKEHIDTLIHFAKQYNIDGIEIDYERIAEKDVFLFSQLIEELYLALQHEGLSLSVVLEPSFPFGVELPSGPDYRVMAYNLFGFHSGPGPKANKKFLKKLVKNIDRSNQSMQLAFAVGGFTWSNTGEVSAVTEEDVKQIIQRFEVEPIRDSSSGALSFHYVESGQQYEVWYADVATIHTWINIVQSMNPAYEHFTIWRAGGMSEEMMKGI